MTSSGSSPPQRWRPRPRTSSDSADTCTPTRAHARPSPRRRPSRRAEGSLTSSRAEQPVCAPLQHGAAISAAAAAVAAVRRVARIAGVATICHRPNDEGSYLTTLDMAPRRFGRAAPNGTLPSGRVLAVTSCQVLRPPQPSNNGRNHFLRPGSLPLFKRQDVRFSGGMRARPSACVWADRLHHGQGRQRHEAAERAVRIY